MIKLGSTDIANMIIGNTQVQSAYLGTTKVWSFEKGLPKVGDYVYKDMTYSSLYDSSKEVAGIIFHILYSSPDIPSIMYIIHPEEMGVRQYDFYTCYGNLDYSPYIGSTGQINSMYEENAWYFPNITAALTQSDSSILQQIVYITTQSPWLEFWSYDDVDSFDPDTFPGWGLPFKKSFSYENSLHVYSPIPLKYWEYLLSPSVLTTVNQKISEIGGNAVPIRLDGRIYATGSNYSVEDVWYVNPSEYQDGISNMYVSNTNDQFCLRAMTMVSLGELS